MKSQKVIDMENLSDKTEKELLEEKELLRKLELLKELGELKRQLLELTLKKCAGVLSKFHTISDLKKQIARLHTFLR